MSTSHTFTGTDTYSVSDVKAVMQNTYEDIIGFANREMITYALAKSWIDDLTYMVNKKVIKFFEIQLYDKYGTWFKSYRYDVDSYGYLSTGSLSGGINFYSFAEGTTARLLVELDYANNNATAVKEELQRRGWGVGSASEGAKTYQRSYTSNNLQLKRSEITKA